MSNMDIKNILQSAGLFNYKFKAVDLVESKSFHERTR